ncbi:hypothetical protein D9757_010258 [Collybiopsis confluens]|uniref:Uncharacterized protein n=1 Tax=Collybiopsis confluens TaxID=2823264 RepID=A0A8H5HB41_9AGAR|nr:hypothetical protein D9757_010258 [Collybiopsis confluens]
MDRRFGALAFKLDIVHVLHTFTSAGLSLASRFGTLAREQLVTKQFSLLLVPWTNEPDISEFLRKGTQSPVPPLMAASLTSEFLYGKPPIMPSPSRRLPFIVALTVVIGLLLQQRFTLSPTATDLPPLLILGERHLNMKNVHCRTGPTDPPIGQFMQFNMQSSVAIESELASSAEEILTDPKQASKEIDLAISNDSMSNISGDWNGT